MLDEDELRPLDEAHRKGVSQIRKAGEHLLELINDVLDLFKVESGQVILTLETLNPRKSLDECIAIAETYAKRFRVTINNNTLAAPVEAVAVDTARFKQVLLNLLSNAVKYNREGGSVELTSELSDPGFIRFSVRDTGPGISAERHSELFQPFSRLGAEATETEVTGIGLVLSRRLVEQMDGRIGFVTTVGVGSVF